MTHELLILLGAVAVICSLVVVMFVMYHKLSSGISLLREQITLETNQLSTHLFSQIEALSYLEQELKLSHALPPTRGWAASPDFLRNLCMHARSTHPKSVVECSSGISTIVLARCMQLNGQGHVYSLEHDSEYAEKTRQLLRLHGLEGFATVCDAPLKQLTLPKWSGQWYEFDVLPPELAIDMVVVDGPPWFVATLARYPSVPALHQRLQPNGVVFLDDADRPEEKEIVRRWLAEFPDLENVQVAACEKGCTVLKKQLIQT